MKKAASILAIIATAVAQEPCSPASNTFTASVNFFEGQLGYYEFEECDGVNPTLGLEFGVTYTFKQVDPSNWFHPMGFAYFPDGALDDQPELEPGVSFDEMNGCIAELTCPRPKYQLDGAFLGEDGTDNFGLDDYEPKFFLPILDWIGEGEFTIELTFDDATIDQDIFYFCHIHQFMSGRIKILDAGVPRTTDDETPPLGYEYDELGEFDEMCGSFGLDQFQLPNEFCPDRFVCEADSATTPSLSQYAECIDAMNCAMMSGMTTGVSENEKELFIYQMIPHHENAINMAKALMNSGTIPCDDLTNEDDPNCIMQVISREIINGQNFQIQTMRGVLDAMSSPATNDCEVPVKTLACDTDDSCSDGLLGNERVRMNKLIFGVFCYDTCVLEQNVDRNLILNWNCGGC